MKRRFVVVTVVAVAAILVAMMIVSWFPKKPDSRPDTAAPLHSFIADDHLDRDVIDCGIGKHVDVPGSLRGMAPPPCRLGADWKGPLQSDVWQTRRHEELSFAIERPAPRRLVMRCAAQPHPRRQIVQTMVVRVNGHRLTKIEVPAKWSRLSVSIPKEVQRPGRNRIKMAFAYEAPLRPGQRPRRTPLVSARFKSIALEKTALFSRAGGRRRADIANGHVYDENLGRFVVARPGRLVYPITIPEEATGLGIEVRVPPKLDRKRTSLALTIENADCEPRRTVRLPIGDRRFEKSTGVLSGEISVDGFRGVDCLLTFQVDPQPPGASLQIAPPVAIGPSHVRVDNESIDLESTGGPRKPDVVLITLDAARPDHFGCYGYSRPTTPNIDRLAEESLLFRNAFALAPYTRCSVPTMITGLSFVNHGVVSDQQVLSDAAVTLAEHFRDSGYKTACFSDTPNNSRARGFDQGYDEFIEMWRSRSDDETSRPHRMSRRVVEWLASQDETAPFHLQLHYLPPHEPYDPPPAFDLYTDPKYSGSFTGTVKTLKAINSGRLRPTDTDIEHLIALYDGNLRTVDDAVGTVLRALQERPRWRDTVVLVTSDHGEAFYEHGRMGHNSPLFDEMMRVPFILRTPDGFAPAVLNTDRLVSLADIVPTMVAGAVGNPTGDVDGINLLRNANGGQPSIGRYLVLRDAHNVPLLGLRSLRWKLMLTTPGHGALYDVQSDPGERHDLVLDRPDLFVGLAQLVARSVSRPVLVPPSAERAEIDETDRKMLRALGYVD